MAEPVVTAEETALRETARRVLPAGSFGNVPFETVIRSGQGSHVWDVSGNEYIDYLLGSGPMLAGHCHPEVVEAVKEQVGRGTTFFANNEHGIRLAEAVIERVACAEKVRFVSSGSEATFYAMRIARAFRGRDKILKFEGGFHGMNDYALMSMAPKRPGNFPQAAPDSAGIPAAVRDEVLIAPFNDAETAVQLIRDHADELAAAIVEPFQRLIPPKPGFLEALREVTEETGVVLIFDEVVTGFRFARGGAQERYGVTPDMCSLGKVVGGGYPLAAIAGRDDIMAHFDAGRVDGDRFAQQIGTLSGNPVAAVAGLKTLEVLGRPGVYERHEQIGEALIDGLETLLEESGHEGQVLGSPPMFDVIFTSGEVADYRATMRADAAKTNAFNAGLRARGIFKGQSKFYLSVVHSDEDIANTLDAARESLKELP